MATAPCTRTDWHINPKPETNGLALLICGACPAIQSCAKDALEAGASLDGSYTRPANDVVQAGVICRGDDDTAEQLAAVAGVPVPEYRDHRPRPSPPEQCLGCGMPMVKRQRTGTQPVDDSTVIHMGHGKCTDCYMKGKRGEAWQTRISKKGIGRNAA